MTNIFPYLVELFPVKLSACSIPPASSDVQFSPAHIRSIVWLFISTWPLLRINVSPR
ncbi:hypothetical protein EDWATA_01483 [Edwardsiella tarda ATCC 23685]|uniref:Uncharacterized protein n=1 Tax=Edwardsiella tarda ATCC 23685 TaxID=500638 RepID=D4F414_EDWTA|nr:hypothetical protein EDWATA_01483 [Edwardsiella tarda ATCC 23685]